MIILSLRTDSPDAELGIYENHELIDHLSFKAERELADKIHTSIKNFLEKNNLSLKNLDGIIVYKGPGSFTGLRIGLSVANTLAYALKIPVCGADHDDWQKEALDKIISGKSDTLVIPFYGAEPNITKPKK